MTKGYVKDFFGNNTEMQSWIFDNGIEVCEKDFDNDLIKNGMQVDGGDYIGFAVYKTEYEPEEWTEYYTKTLPKNGTCSVTMQEDYIPEAYPAKIMSVTDKSKIFAKGSGVGYIASQKIIHTMQYLNWYKVVKNK